MANASEPEDQLPPAEAARARRRDRDARAAERKGMRTGLAKQFKQVLDAQAKRAGEASRPTGSRQPPKAPEPKAPEPREPGQPEDAPG